MSIPTLSCTAVQTTMELTDAMAMLLAMPPSDLVIWPVSKRVNSPRNGADDSDLIEAVAL